MNRIFNLLIQKCFFFFLISTLSFQLEDIVASQKMRERMLAFVDRHDVEPVSCVLLPNLRPAQITAVVTQHKPFKCQELASNQLV